MNKKSSINTTRGFLFFPEIHFTKLTPTSRYFTTFYSNSCVRYLSIFTVNKGARPPVRYLKNNLEFLSWEEALNELNLPTDTKSWGYKIFKNKKHLLY